MMRPRYKGGYRGPGFKVWKWMHGRLVLGRRLWEVVVKYER